MKILILGNGKSGTTALFAKIRSSLPADTFELFEPRSFEAEWTERIRSAPHVVVKSIFWETLRSVYPRVTFDKKILIVRDPRDQLVSLLLYSPWNLDLHLNPEGIRRCVELLRKKEASPRSLSCRELAGSITGDDPRISPEGLRDHMQSQIAFHRENPEFLLYLYEDLARGDFGTVETHLGLALTGSTKLGPELDRVVRSKSSGDWRHWFTEEDVAHYRPAFEPYMRHYGYDDDWTLEPNPEIDPHHASLYVLRILNQKRKWNGLRRVRVPRQGGWLSWLGVRRR